MEDIHREYWHELEVRKHKQIHRDGNRQHADNRLILENVAEAVSEASRRLNRYIDEAFRKENGLGPPEKVTDSTGDNHA